MSRFSETETALLERLRTMKAAPGVSINLFDVRVPMNAAGYSQKEIMGVLDALEQDKIVTYGPGNRLLILKDLPDG